MPIRLPEMSFATIFSGLPGYRVGPGVPSELRRAGTARPTFRSALIRIVMGCLLLSAVCVGAQSVTTNCTSFIDLRAFLAVNNDIQFNCGGTIAFTDSISITQDTVIDGG